MSLKEECLTSIDLAMQGTRLWGEGEQSSHLLSEIANRLAAAGDADAILAVLYRALHISEGDGQALHSQDCLAGAIRAIDARDWPCAKQGLQAVQKHLLSMGAGPLLTLGSVCRLTFPQLRTAIASGELLSQRKGEAEKSRELAGQVLAYLLKGGLTLTRRLAS